MNPNMMEVVMTMEPRREKVLKILGKTGSEAFFLIGQANIRFLSGFTGTDGYVFLSPGARIFLTDSRYVEQAETECPDFEIIDYRSSYSCLEEALAHYCTYYQIKKLGFEADIITFACYQKLKDQLSDVALVPTNGVVKNVRRIKDDREIHLLKKAAQIGDEAFAEILPLIKPGVTEKNIEIELEYLMKKKGALSSSFPIIVASGPRSSLPHAIPTDRKICKGDFITLDYGALYEGYCSDMTRTVVVGQPDQKQREIYQLVKKAQDIGVQTVRGGMLGKEVDQAARSVIAKAGYGDYFGHGLGHGIGLEVHEEPVLNSRSDHLLPPGSVVTVEPGIYLPIWGGVRIEDSVVVRPEGCEIITRATKDLIIL
jgi:Xaa-Pro aminopeptidase